MSNFTIQDQNNDHKYFTLLQNILSSIGLTAFERSVYWALKECAGEHGSCTKSYAKLAVMAGLSIPSLKRTLETLSEKNKILKKPLIQIINRLTEYGDRDTNEIVLASLWNDNMKHFQKENGQVTQNSPKVRQTQPQVTPIQGVRSHRPEGQVTQSYKEEPFNKNPYEEEQHTPKAPLKFGACVVLFSSDYEKFCQDNGKVKIDLLIEEMNDYCLAHGKTYKAEAGYAAAMRNWLRRRKQDAPSKNTNTDRRTQNKDGSPIVSPADGRF